MRLFFCTWQPVPPANRYVQGGMHQHRQQCYTTCAYEQHVMRPPPQKTSKAPLYAGQIACPMCRASHLIRPLIQPRCPHHSHTHLLNWMSRLATQSLGGSAHICRKQTGKRSLQLNILLPSAQQPIVPAQHYSLGFFLNRQKAGKCNICSRSARSESKQDTDSCGHERMRGHYACAVMISDAFPETLASAPLHPKSPQTVIAQIGQKLVINRCVRSCLKRAKIFQITPSLKHQPHPLSSHTAGTCILTYFSFLTPLRQHHPRLRV